MGRVVYVTGAPATGKSTLCRAISERFANTENFCYSERLRDHVNRQRREAIDEVAIRRESAKAISADDVQAMDSALHEAVRVTHGSDRNLLIDSHPVTKEDYGFRITPFSSVMLKALELDAIICLYADAQMLAQRIQSDAQGRPLPTTFELETHVQSQIGIASQYSVISGIPCFLVDSGVSRERLVDTVIHLSGIEYVMQAH